jgi:cell division protein FtsL
VSFGLTIGIAVAAILIPTLVVVWMIHRQRRLIEGHYQELEHQIQEQGRVQNEVIQTLFESRAVDDVDDRLREGTF